MRNQLGFTFPYQVVYESGAIRQALHTDVVCRNDEVSQAIRDAFAHVDQTRRSVIMYCGEMVK